MDSDPQTHETQLSESPPNTITNKRVPVRHQMAVSITSVSANSPFLEEPPVSIDPEQFEDAPEETMGQCTENLMSRVKACQIFRLGVTNGRGRMAHHAAPNISNSTSSLQFSVPFSTSTEQFEDALEDGWQPEKSSTPNEQSSTSLREQRTSPWSILADSANASEQKVKAQATDTNPSTAYLSSTSREGPYCTDLHMSGMLLSAKKTESSMTASSLNSSTSRLTSENEYGNAPTCDINFGHEGQMNFHAVLREPVTSVTISDASSISCKTTERKSWSPPNEIVVTENDVLCGRGGLSNKHPGNASFRKLVRAKKVAYRNSRKSTKTAISREIVEAVQARGGRFLKKQVVKGLLMRDEPSTMIWKEIDGEKARLKTSQALREKDRRFEIEVESDIFARKVHQCDDLPLCAYPIALSRVAGWKNLEPVFKLVRGIPHIFQASSK